MKIKKLNLSIILLIAICIALFTSCTQDTTKSIADDGLEVHFMDVGQADSILLVSSDKAMLIDAGDTDAENVIIPYIKNLGIEKLDVVIFTHPHKDHIGSGASVIENFDIGNIYMSSKTTTTKTFEKLLDSIELKGADIIIPSVGEKIEFGNCDVTVLGPVKEYNEINDNSIVVKVEYNDIKFLFTGDMEENSEKDIIDSLVDLDVDVLKVAHHGSTTSSSYVFLREVNPKYAVISSGIDNDYNHPHEKILSRLNDVGAEILRTDKMGTIVAKVDGKELTFNQTGINSSNNDKTNENTNQSLTTTYIGNINSKILHLETCKSLPKEKNRVYFKDRDKAIIDGYEPCSQCNP